MAGPTLSHVGARVFSPLRAFWPLLLRYRRLGIVAAHVGLVPVAYWLAFALRFDLTVPGAYQTIFWATLPYLLVLRLATFAWFGLNRGWLRHTGMEDLVDLLKAVTLSSALFVAALYVTGQVGEMPRSILVIDWAAAVLLFGGTRLAVRTLREGHLVRSRRLPGKPTLIIGAGNAAAGVLRGTRSGLLRGICPVT